MDTTANKTKRDLVVENDDLRKRVERMERMISEQRGEGTYTGPQPVMYHDPFDMGINPHHIKKNPPGKVLGWKNPNLRNSASVGWKGWTPVSYDDEIGQNLSKYINDPPDKLVGSASQDNYVRRGTDSVLCWLDEDIFKARQQRREQKALHQQMVASAHGNSMLREGVSTFGDGVQIEKNPERGNDPPQDNDNPSKRTEMFRKE